MAMITSLALPAGVVGDNPFREGVVSGFLLILFSEIGDKTFFIALLLALKQSRSSVFVGTFGALAVMTVISVALGQVFHKLDELLPQTGLPLDDVLAAVLLVFFGVKTLQVRLLLCAPEGPRSLA
jgi:putative Ca2+/H+ antiporter (TMEM165/GDT1 family)